MERNDFINTKIKINLDSTEYKNKPDNVGKVVNELKRKETITEITVSELTAAICRGQSITAGVLIGAGDKYWTEQQLFMWDFDNGAKTLPHVTPQEILDTFAAVGLYSVFAYYSFSHKPEHEKFRVACLSNRIIYDTIEREKIIKGVMQLFPTAIEPDEKSGKDKTVAQVDLQCTDASRLFYGTNKGLIDIFETGKTFDPDEIIKLYVEPEPAKVERKAFKYDRSTSPELYGHLDLIHEYSIFPLYDYIKSTYIFTKETGGIDKQLTPCPICKHNKDFNVNIEKNLYKCHSTANGTGGNILNFLQEANNWTADEAREHFKYKILGIDEQRERQEWKDSQRQNNSYQSTPPPSDGDAPPNNNGKKTEPPPQETPPLLWFNEIEEEDIDWYWYPYIQRGEINSIVATQSTGKSFLVCKVASMASIGKRHELPYHDKHYNYHPFSESETTLYLNAEDDPAKQTKKRLKLCGADMSKIATVELQNMNFNFYNPRIEEWLIQSKPSLLVFDPIQQFFVGSDPYGKPLDMNDSSSVRPAFTHLKMLAKKYNVAIVLIMHPNKSILQSALYSAMGSNDMTAAPRSSVYIGRDPDNRERRIIAMTKANSVPDSDQVSIAFKWAGKDMGIEFDGISDLQADDIRDTKRKNRSEQQEPNKKEKAAEWLENILYANNGYMKLADIEKERKEVDITQYALYEAKAKCSKFIRDTGKGKGTVTYWYIVGYEPPEQLNIE